MVTLSGAAAYKNGSRRSVKEYVIEDSLRKDAILEALEMWPDVLGHSALSNKHYILYMAL